jgi:hypothetical protein
MYGHAAVFYKNQIIVFGGGDNVAGLLRSEYSINQMYKLTFDELPCSDGTYVGETKQTPCIACVPGYYSALSNAEACLPCPKGTFSSKIGANSS